MEKISAIRSTKFMLDLIWKKKFGKTYILLKIIISTIDSIIPTVYTLIFGLIINALVSGNDISILISYISIMVISPIIMHFIHHYYDKVNEKICYELQLNMEIDYYDTVLDMDYEAYEIPEIQVKKIRSKMTLMGALGVVDTVSQVVSSVFALIAITSIISTLNPFMIIVVISVLVANYVIAKKFDIKLHDLDKQRSKHDMVLAVYQSVLEKSEIAKETRLYQTKEFLINNYCTAKRKLYKFQRHLFSVQRFTGTFNVITNAIQQSAMYAVILYEVIKNGMEIGNVTVYIAAVNQFSGALNAVLGSYRSLSNISLRVQDYIDFMNTPKRQNRCGKDLSVHSDCLSIEFRNVSFRYPGSEQYVLKHVNLKIKKGEKICIVGENGAGKSTFIKLLTRLYSPTDGEILMNGININDYELYDYQHLFATVFQDFSEYPFSIEKNITLNDECDNELFEKACKQSGISSLIEKLPKGCDTPVGKEIYEDGINPSGGEGQRIAIARALYHDREVYILDEPTAALDPNAEYEIYTQFHNMIKDKTAILITHRLSAVQLADKVAVFDDGHVAEYGTHAELYAKGGIYTEMFDKQAQFYRDAPSASNGIGTDMEDI